MKEVNLKLAKIGMISILIYATLHLLEEGLLGFPAWVSLTWNIPNYTLERWLIHNFFFLGVQLALFTIHLSTNFRYLFIPVGIVIWGVINSLNHVIFTFYSGFSPGLITSFIFIILFVWVLREIKGRKDFRNLILQSIGLGIALWIIPIILFLLFDIFVLKIV